RDSRHSAGGRDPRRARAGDQGAHSAEDTRRRHPPIPSIQPRAWRKPGAARREGGEARGPRDRASRPHITEVSMSSTPMRNEHANEVPSGTVETKLEVVDFEAPGYVTVD